MLQNIIGKVEFFIFIMCLLYTIRIGLQFSKALYREKEMEITRIETILFYLSISYIVTSIFSLF
jgi:ABC-type iron transport system FetAB permease component